MIVNGHEIELLAPAGNIDNLKTAVLSGADSVYFGLSSFNARRNAENFSSKEEVFDAVEFCHLRGARAHVTLNTLIYDSEVSEFIKSVRLVGRAGFDAVIVQDLGCINILRDMSDIPLHASTQMTVHSVSDARKLKDMGFSRVVLARELSLDEIRRITESVDIETEVFMHGALCMSVSGQCYFSSALGERSGNRGLCAGVCRLPFGVKDKSRYALSLKDLSLIEHIDELAEAGVRSLKIEGRMKNSSYVHSVVTETLKKVESGKYDRKLLEEVFSREGFTDGYLTGKRNNMFGVRAERNKETTRNIASEDFTMPEGKKYPLSLEYSFETGKPMELKASSQNHEITVCDSAVEKAKKKPSAKESIEKNLSKFGGTVYYPEEVRGKLSEDAFVPLSKVNALRREITERFDEFILSKYPKWENRKAPEITKRRSCNEKRRIGIFSNPEVIDEKIADSFDTLFVPLFKVGRLDRSIYEKYRKKLGVTLPRIFFEEEKILTDKLRELKADGIHLAMAHTIGRCALLGKLGFDIYSGFGMNIANSYAVDLMEREFGAFKGITCSFENTLSRINKISSSVPLGMIVYGRIPVMITRNCPVKEEISCSECRKNSFLVDRKNESFPVRCHAGTTEIYNSHALCVFERDERIKDDIDRLFLFTTEDRAQIRKVISAFERKKNLENTTRGSYFRKLT